MDVLHKVAYYITNDEWDNRKDQSKKLWVRPSGNAGNSSGFEYVNYYSFVDLVDFERYASIEDACIEVIVSELTGRPDNGHGVRIQKSSLE